MNENDHTGLIPENTEGKKITAASSTSFENNVQAAAFYKTARERLLSVRNWGSMTGALSADFALTDEKGIEVDRTPQKGDHFRIDIPGPGSSAGQGYDWARVEDIREVSKGESASIAIMVRPASNPRTDNPDVAHFYSEKSSSTFIVTLENKGVTGSIYDRNIQANEETNEPKDKLRNAIAGFGAKRGFSKLQWQALADSIVELKGHH